MSHGFVPFAEVKQMVSMEAVLARYQLLDGLTKKGANLAGSCPFCNARSARLFQANLAKNAWYCFGCKAGGNVLDFVAKKEKASLREAALLLDRWFALGLAGESRPDTPALPEPAEDDDVVEREPLPAENPPLTFSLKTLDPGHESLAPLGLSPATLEAFGAGYASKGLMKGRLAIPVRNRAGALVAYAGLSLGGESPRWLFPPKFQPALEVVNLDRLPEFAGEDDALHLAPDALGVLRLREAGVASVVGLFDGSLSAAQEEAIADALTLYERLVLVGEGFADRTVARLARHASLTWIGQTPIDPLK